MKTIRCLAVALSIFLLVNAACVRIPVRTSGTLEPQQLADPDSLFLELAGVAVHYKLYPARPIAPAAGSAAFPLGSHAGDVGKIAADRPLIVLLQGFGASLFSWREVVGPLSVYGAVVAYDRPAFGLTGRPGMTPAVWAPRFCRVTGLPWLSGAGKKPCGS